MSATATISTLTTATAGGNSPATSPLNADDHYILKKLCNELLPWLIGGRLLRRQWFVRVAAVYEYVTGAAAALAGLGIGGPIAAVVTSGKTPDDRPIYASLSDVLPQYLVITGIVAAIFWVGIRLIVQKQNVLSRALLARDCATKMRALDVELLTVLPERDPLPRIGDVQKKVLDRVQNAVMSEIWPWNGTPPTAMSAADLERSVNDIRARFMAGWNPPPEVT